MKFALGKKLEMTQIFEDGKVVPITLIETMPGVITQVKTKEKDGYDALQIGFAKKEKKTKTKKPEKGKEFKFLREYRQEDQEPGELKMGIGDKVDIDVFEKGDKVKVSGLSKGKGFQGVVKRWGFHGRSASHGMKHDLRKGGSIGAAGVGKVFKGRKMPGRMGYKKITIRGLTIIKIDAEKRILAVKGAVPGRRGTVLEIKG